MNPVYEAHLSSLLEQLTEIIERVDTTSDNDVSAADVPTPVDAEHLTV
jgi:hypothetical protein